MTLLLLVFGAFTGTILRYLLCKWKIKDFAIGLLICNLLGSYLALVLININPVISLALFGSLTSMSSLVKESKEHILITILLLFVILSII